MLGKKGFRGEPGWLRVSAEAFSLFGQFTTAGPGDATTISISCHRMSPGQVMLALGKKEERLRLSSHWGYQSARSRSQIVFVKQHWAKHYRENRLGRDYEGVQGCFVKVQWKTLLGEKDVSSCLENEIFLKLREGQWHSNVTAEGGPASFQKSRLTTSHHLLGTTGLPNSLIASPHSVLSLGYKEGIGYLVLKAWLLLLSEISALLGKFRSRTCWRASVFLG